MCITTCVRICIKVDGCIKVRYTRDTKVAEVADLFHYARAYTMSMTNTVLRITNQRLTRALYEAIRKLYVFTFSLIS